jgi:hypothetical protein
MGMNNLMLFFVFFLSLQKEEKRTFVVLRRPIVAMGRPCREVLLHLAPVPDPDDPVSSPSPSIFSISVLCHLFYSICPSPRVRGEK